MKELNTITFIQRQFASQISFRKATATVQKSGKHKAINNPPFCQQCIPLLQPTEMISQTSTSIKTRPLTESVPTNPALKRVKPKTPLTERTRRRSPAITTETLNIKVVETEKRRSRPKFGAPPSELGRQREWERSFKGFPKGRAENLGFGCG